MSERYVWSIYAIAQKYEHIQEEAGTSFSIQSSDGLAYFGSSYTFNEETGKFTLTGNTTTEGFGSRYDSLSAVSYPYLILTGGYTGDYIVDGTPGYRWRDYSYWSDSGKYDIVLMNRDDDDAVHAIAHRAQLSRYKGDIQGACSAQSPAAYPSDGIFGNLWYTYEGQDNIDPSAVSIPAAVAPGQRINITVTPGSGEVYGGTVSYLYQVRLDGGAWQTVATTTATTQAYTVPSWTQSIQVRVRAQDDMGFTSSTYVESSSVNVVGAPGSITVPGAAMTGQTYEVLWDAVTNVDSYKLERRVNSESWTTVYTGPGLSYTDTAVVGWSRVQYRVSAGTGGAYGTPLESDTVDIISAASLVISGADGSLGTITAPVTYSVTSDTGNQITVTETINGHSRTLNPASGAQIAIPVSMIDPAADDTGEITIQASVRATSGTVTQTRNWTYTKTPLTLPTKAYRVEQLQGGAKDVMPLTLAEAVMLPDGSSVADYVNTPTVFAAKTTQNSITMPFTPSMVVFSSLETSRGYGQNAYLVYQGDSFLDGYSWRITLSGNTISKSGGSDDVNGMKIIAFA